MSRIKKLRSTAVTKKIHPLLSSQRVRAILAVAATASIGFWSISGLRAAPFSIGSEAEAGTIAGNAVLTNDTTASGGKTVAFGQGTPAAPSGLQALTGGNSVAIRWDPSIISGDTIQSYKIFRNNVQIGTINPNVFNADYPEKNYCGFVDKNITKGTTYSYQVQAVSTNHGTSPMSATVSAKPPTSTTPTPNFTYNLNGATDLDSFMRNTVGPFLQIWYPKIGDAIAFPDYTPTNTLTLTLDPNYNGIAYTSWEKGEIVFSTTWLRSQYTDPTNHDRTLGAWAHEATHVIQGNPGINKGSNAQGFAVEGGADYTREYIMKDRPAVIPASSDSYVQGYSQGAFIINYITKTYNSTYMRKITIDGHNQQFGIGDITFPDGKNIDEAWSAALGLPNSTGPFKSVSTGKCLDAPNANTTPGTPLQMYDCLGNVNQKMTAWPNSNGLALHIVGNCAVPVNDGTTAGTGIWLVGCDQNNIAQAWNIMPDGSIVNVKSGLCLDIPNSGNGGANATNMELWNCNGGGWQKWTLPANSYRVTKAGAIAFRSATSKCLDDPSGSTTNSTLLQVYDCNGQPPQKWYYTADSKGVITLSVLGKCMDVQLAGTASGTPVQIYSCNRTGAQIWKEQANGSLLNVSSNKCLDTVGSSITNGAHLVINDCNGSASQTFNFPN